MKIFGLNITKAKNITVNENSIVVDGKETDFPANRNITIHVEGDVEVLKVKAGNVTVTGAVDELEVHAGNVKSGNVTGDISVRSGNVECGSVKGSINTKMGNIRHQ